MCRWTGAAGASSFNLRRLGSLALLGLTSFTTLPLRVWSVIGGWRPLAALLYGGWITLETLLFGADLAGWPTLAASIMLFSGVQLMSIGILGEYIGRIYDEVNSAPAICSPAMKTIASLREQSGDNV